MEHIERFLVIDLPPGQSTFLWGPRKTGKSTYLQSRFPKSLRYDLLRSDVYFELSTRPWLFREQLSAQSQDILNQPVIVDEVQKVPPLLDEVHWLIENRGLRFVLCGSSARKLKRGKANLLGGRAWRFEMFPLAYPEMPNLNLLRALNRGLIPAHHFQKGHRRALRSYVHDYLKEEIAAEGLTRYLPAFSRFFDAMAYSHGELTNYSNIARECGVDSKTVREYYQILVDTLMGRFVEPYARKPSRQIILRTPKFYLFDVGVAGRVTNRILTEERGESFGRAFEHYILMEIMAHSSYKELHYGIHFWRTKSGLEVDFILGDGEVAIEVKGSQRVERRDLHGIQAFVRDYSPRTAIVVCNEREMRVHQGIHILPWRRFLEELWGGSIIH